MSHSISPEPQTLAMNGRFYFLDALRGLVAVWVVLFHIYIQQAETILPFLEAIPAWLADFIFKKGYVGVSVFFVLSGFVIAYSCRKAKIDVNYFRNFLLKRFIRLTPPYYAAIGIALAFAVLDTFIRGDEFPVSSPAQFAANLLYTHYIFREEAIIDVSWTLCLEIQFYAIFCILLALSQRLEYKYGLKNSSLLVFLSTGLISIILPSLLPLDIFVTYLGTTFCPKWYSFLLGVFAYWVWTKRIRVSWFCFYATLVVLMAIAGGNMASGDGYFILGSVFTAIVILGVAQINHLSSCLNWPWLQFLGAISYSLYLTHAPMISASSYLWNRLTEKSSFFTAFMAILFIFVCCILLALLIYLIIEKPSIWWSRQLLFSPSFQSKSIRE